MTAFQLIASVVFVALAAVAYRSELAKLARRVVPTAQQAADVKPSIARTIVNDLLAVTELRDKLAAEDCADGVEACTNLLRVIVEQTKPAAKHVVSAS